MLDKDSTTNLKGFMLNNQKVEGLIRFDDNFNLKLEPKKQSVTSNAAQKSLNDRNDSEKISCPKCKKGTILKGKTAYGCSNYKNGCDFIFTFEKIKEIANGKPLTKEFVLKIIST